ncbi:MAG: NAD(P)/FAD-dependent oxidoreductase [Desulfovibrio sp.]|jgi:dihydrolipoamide dehydrogenase|nr:NAD(P)/FAD-dependent oxidoreductase [Desulfovibrio sp.]
MGVNGRFDLVVLGGGPGGTRAVLDAAGFGMSCALVEAAFLGGTCLNVGCIPTKFLLGGSASIASAAAQRRYKVARSLPDLDFTALQTRKARFVKGLRLSVEKQMQEAGVKIFRGRGSFCGEDRLRVEGGDAPVELSFSSCIVAAGSIAAFFPGLRADGASVLSSAGLLAAKKVPDSLIIVGGGAIGLELGEIFHRFGCRVSIVEAQARLLPGEDEEIGECFRAHFAREGWSIHTGRSVASLLTVDGRSRLRFADGEEIEAEKSLIATGRRPRVKHLAPEAAGLELTDRGWIKTDENLMAARRIYAVGDVNGRVQLAHAADHQARFAAAHAAGRERGPYTPPAMPSCVYGSMEAMRVGPTALELKREGREIFLSRAPLAGNAIAQSTGSAQGMVRMLWEGDELRGVSAAGHGVSHLVTAAALLLAGGVKKNMPLPVIFAHPTLDESLETAIVAPTESIV